MTVHDLVVRGGRVLDPESGTDGIRDVGVSGGRIAEVSETPLEGTRVVDATGQVVAPGFVDLHSHCDDVLGMRLQAFDGVTTALEMEGGRYPVAAAYEAAARAGRPINYGFSTSWAGARLQLVTGVPGRGLTSEVFAAVSEPRWLEAVEPARVERLAALVEDDLATGSLGVGILMGYAPDVPPSEYVAIAAAAARAGRPTYTHARELIEQNPDTPVDGAEEIVRTAGETGAHMHYCHVNSTSMWHVDRVCDTVAHAVAAGATVTTEAYPYGSGMTAIGASFLAPDVLHRRGLAPSAVQHLASGRRMADAAELDRVRAEHGTDMAFLHLFDEADPAAMDRVVQTVLFGDIVASDAIEPHRPATAADPMVWPPAPEVVAHPRTAGTFARTLRVLVRERGAIDLMEAVRRCALLPAQIGGRGVPALARKGRLSAGADADLVVFDPAIVTDNATYEHPVRPSSGFAHVLVHGEAVVRDGELVHDALPGRPVRA